MRLLDTICLTTLTTTIPYFHVYFPTSVTSTYQPIKTDANTNTPLNLIIDLQVEILTAKEALVVEQASVQPTTKLCTIMASNWISKECFRKK